LKDPVKTFAVSPEGFIPAVKGFVLSCLIFIPALLLTQATFAHGSIVIKIVDVILAVPGIVGMFVFFVLMTANELLRVNKPRRLRRNAPTSVGAFSLACVSAMGFGRVEASVPHLYNKHCNYSLGGFVKKFSNASQSIVAIYLFAAAAVMLMGIVIASRLGFNSLAHVLTSIAGPLCAAAAAVLMNRLFGKTETDPEA